MMRSILAALLLLLFARPVLSDDAALTQLKTDAGAAQTQRDAAQTEFQNAATLLRTQEQQLLKSKRELDQANKQLKEQQDALPKQQEALTKATEPKTNAEKALEEATKTNEAPKIEEAKKTLEAATKPFSEADAVVKKTNETIAAAQAAIAKANETIAKLDPEVTALKTRVPELETTARTAKEAWVVKQKAVEQNLKAAGQWISFSHEVAPVFYQRCLACHNARMAKGRLNMDHYAALMKGGESGPAVEAGKADCNLCTQISDGSMPQDADPLTPEQIALVKKWVELGAPLDAGIEPQSPLIRIMPKLAQPPAPETYKVAVPVTAVAISPDGKLIATGGYHEVILWNAADATVARRIGNVAERVHQIVWTADSQRLVVAGGTPGQAGEVKVFQVADGAVLADLVTMEDSVFGAAFSPDGSRLAVCGADRSIRIFDVATWKEQVLIEDHADWVMDVAWSPDGKRIASASRDKTSKVFDSTSGDGIATFSAHADGVYTVGFMADNAHIVSGGNDKQLRVWKIADAQQVRNMGLGGEVFRLKMLPENKVLCCSADKTARIYDASNGQQVKIYQGAKEWIYSADTQKDTGKVVTGSYDGEVRIWNADNQQMEKAWIAAPGFTPPQTAGK
jgi:hypothetical protein